MSNVHDLNTRQVRYSDCLLVRGGFIFGFGWLEHAQVRAGEGRPDRGLDLEPVLVLDFEHVVVKMSRPDNQFHHIQVVHVELVVALPLEVHVDLDAGDL